MYLLVSVCLSVHLSVNALMAEPFDRHYQSKMFRLCVCNLWAYADNCTDAVDRLLIGYGVCQILVTGWPH